MTAAESTMTIWLWVGFIVLVVAMLALDLGVLNRKPHTISTREALLWTMVWIAVSLSINVVVYFMYDRHWLGMGTQPGYEHTGRDAAIQFLTGYLVEYSLSLDNIFVIAVIFGYFAVPSPYQHRVLFWGILGALVMRGTMIGAGIAIIQQFSWIIYFFGALLVFTAGKMLFSKEDDEVDLQNSPVIKVVKRFFPITDRYYGEKFFVTENGKRAATPLFLALVVVETTDVLFAVDSVPAVFSVTLDPFIVFTSNVCAILGLRSLYFALAAMLDKFKYIKFSLVFILAFVGVKMLVSHYYHVSGTVSLGVIASALVLGVVASLVVGEGGRPRMPTPMGIDLVEVAQTTIRTVKRGLVVAAGITLLLTGIAMIVLPASSLILLAGLALLATEFVWAQVLLKRARDRVAQLTGDARRFLGKKK